MMAATHSLKPRTTRVMLQVPLLISGVDAEGKRFEAPGESIVVNKNGAEISCPRALRPDSDIVVTIPRNGRVTQARVVWGEKKPIQPGQHQYGIRLLKSENFWGVYFPPGDWDEPEPGEASQEKPAVKAAPLAPSPTESSSPAISAVAPTPPRPAAPPLPPLQIPARGIEVVVRGMSAARIPFQERSHLRPLNEREAQIEVHPVVDVGALVHLVFPAENRALKARTTAVADRQQSDRWRMWVSLAEPVKLV